MPGNDDPEAKGAEEVAAAVDAGRDFIEVPATLVEEPDETRPPEPPETLYSQIMRMSLAEKVKLALRGNRTARVLLARDRVKSIRRFVLNNPRISEEEIIAIARNRQADQELLDAILSRKEWMKLYPVRHALVRNPKTPLPVAIQALPTLLRRDVERIAKSHDVAQGVVAQARRLVLSQQKRG